MEGLDPRFVSSLVDQPASDPAYSGGKAASLAVLAQAELPVPAGFVVSTTAYQHFVDEHALAPLIAEVTDSRSAGGSGFDAASARLRQAFEEAPLPGWLGDILTAAYAALGQGPVAVRSSATTEDLPQASFAGQQESILNVVGAADLCDAVRCCWSSLWTARALAYRQQRDIDEEQLSMAVVVQRMVPAEVAGVLFTADPMSGRRDHVVIEAAAGLGAAVVSGHVTPDRWVIDASTRQMLAAPHRRAPAPGEGSAQPLLGDDQLLTLVDLGLRAAERFDCPQDVEWALAEGRCWLVQSRPITSLFPLPSMVPPRDGGLHVYVPLTLVSQGIVEPLTPAGTAFFRTLADGWLRYLLTGSYRRDSADPPSWLPVVAGRLYCDATPVLQRPRLTARMMSGLAMKDSALSAVLRTWLGRNAELMPRRRGLPVPPRLVVSLVVLLSGVLSGLVTSLVAPARTRRRILATTDRQLRRWEQQAGELFSARELVEFVDRLPTEILDLLVRQLPAVYAELMVRGSAEWLTERWLGKSSNLEVVRRWLPHDPTLAMGAELARLARHYAATGTEPSANSPEVEEFLSAYGHRAPDREIDLGLPRLSEDPTYVVELIDSYRRSGEPDQLLTRFQTGSAQATAAATELVSAVRQAKGPLRAGLLRTLLNRHRELGGMRERPKFDMVRAIALARRVLHRVGTALVADGALNAAADVYYLDTTDLRAALARAPGDRPQDLRAVAVANRREFQQELRRRAIPRLLISNGETFYGPPAPEGADGMVGTAVSPGVYEGVVRVLDSPVGAELRPGEVLVAASTDPGWTPLFLLAGALVMEVGGVVSHGAVVAREYGIPAVVGITEATTRLRSGQRVRVDGENGVVTLLAAADTLEPTTNRSDQDR